MSGADEDLIIRPPAAAERPLDELPAQASSQQILAAALVDPRVDPEKIERLLAIQERVEARDGERQFNESIARLQTKIPPIKRTRKIDVKGKTRSRYAALEDIDKQIRPLLAEEGLSVSYDTAIEGKTKIKVIVYVAHRAGHKISREVTLPLDESEYRNAVQNYGATISYARRYALTLALNLVPEDEDDDAQSLSLITEPEIDSINDLIAECSLTPEGVSKFLTFLGVKAISDIPRGAYKPAINFLLFKRRNLGRQK